MKKISLNGTWKLRLDAEENGLAQNWAAIPIVEEYEVKVPGCVQQLDELAEKYLPHNDMRNGYKGIFFMEKTVVLNTLNAGERCRLFLGGVSPTCHIWVNGTYVLKNIYGESHIETDITDYIMEGENRITVAVTEQYAALVEGIRYAGMAWSGIYSNSYIEVCGNIHFEDSYLAIKGEKTYAEGTISNAGPDFDGTISICLNGRLTVAKMMLVAGESKPFSVEVDVTGLPRWSYRTPNLIDVCISCEDETGNQTECTFRTGLRKLETVGDRIHIDGMPTFFKGTGCEYFSPTIAPLTDREVIANRYKAMQDYGFNFFRCHTYVPTEEEMSVADEMGIMLDVELGLVSNFNKTEPIEEGLVMWERVIRQSRRHPSVVIYCIGNEGSQLVAESEIECNRARAAYKVIKENTANQFGLIAFGFQGEVPELPNDIQTPHLWSENFLWAYDGLTDIPWDDVVRTSQGKPCLMHEYGKFAVWPSRKEEQDTTVEAGIKPDHGTQSYRWLERSGLTHLEDKLIVNSRKTANRLNRLIMEDARRQPYVSGYTLWTFFRRTQANAGLADDLGYNRNGEEALFTQGCNAEIAILMDRSFQNRAFACGMEQSITLTVSNFSGAEVNGELQAALLCGGKVLQTAKTMCRSLVGETKEALTFVFEVPETYGNKKLVLEASLVCGDETLSYNNWEFWAFDILPQQEQLYLHMEDLTTYRAIKRVFPRAQRLSSVDSIVHGYYSWDHPKLVDTAARAKDVLIISDQYDEITKACIAQGNRVLLLDTGYLPKEWMLPPICAELGERDSGRFYTSFRAGWDKGNLVTLVEEDALLGSYPQEGFCDLHFFDMIQSARIMKPEMIENVLGGKAKRVVSSISKLPVEKTSEDAKTEPGALHEAVGAPIKFNGREQGYLLKLNDRLSVCTMKLSDNPAGIGLLKQLIR